MLRTNTCGELRAEHANRNVVLCGWVETHRIQGKISFILLRDRYGITQIFVNPEITRAIGSLRNETVIQVYGEVKKRPENQVRKEMSTGEIEISANKIEILNAADPLPLDLNENVEPDEDTRLKYRFLDLRKKRMQRNLLLRHKIVKSMRDFLDKQGFLEIETPILGRSTPEGARDYLVPSRVYKGKFYALPQSPQLYKQLSMVAGYDKYFQIARCFRDEDSRSDRQPEFTQLDIEMSFVEEKDVHELMELLMKHVWKDVLNVDLKIPFQKLTYEESMKKYKSDKPDLRKNTKDPNEYAFEWIVDFPLVEWSKEDNKYNATHHPFTSPKKEDVHFLEKNPEKAKSICYDLVLNGYELGSGSIRIHQREVQSKVFKVLGISDKEAEMKFGFLLNAFRYGAPPHGGIAIGIDRITMIVANELSLREVIAFPKNKEARDLMQDAPNDVDAKQLKELGIKQEATSSKTIVKKKKKK